MTNPTYARRAAAGLCIYCAHLPPAAGRLACEACARAQAEKSRRIHSRRPSAFAARAEALATRARALAHHQKEH